MPDVFEKLVKLLDHVQDYGMKRVKDESSILLVHKTNEMVADQLISHGVTIQRYGRWIPHNKGQNNWVECSVCNTVGSPFWKCCPVCETKMAQPPKGDD